MQENQKNNVIAMVIGIFLIILIAVTTIFRPASKSDDSSGSTDEQQQNIALENMKKTQRISSSDLVTKIQKRDELTLIDIRPEEAFTLEHLMNSQNIILSDIDNTISTLGKDKTYIIIDSGAITDTVSFIINSLSDQGFKNIYYLDGGFAIWKDGYNPTVSAGDPNSFTDQSKVTYIQTDKLKEMLAKETNLAIIDVRKSNQFSEGHLAGAINIFLEDLEKRKNDIPLGKKIILYDNDGLWAFKASVRLFDMGFFNTLALSDGLDTWKKKNYELVK